MVDNSINMNKTKKTTSHYNFMNIKKYDDIVYSGSGLGQAKKTKTSTFKSVKGIPTSTFKSVKGIPTLIFLIIGFQTAMRI